MFTIKRLFRWQYPVALIVIFSNIRGRYDERYFRQKEDCNDLEPGQKGFIQLAKSNEPGEPLVIYGKVIDRATSKPIRNVSLFLYQTDSSGIYNTSGGPDDQARIRGTMFTNETGCFKVRTILPGDYPGSKNSRHLHYVINAEGFKEIKSILFFKGFTTANITGAGPFAVLDINKDNTGTWIGSIDITMERTR